MARLTWFPVGAVALCFACSSDDSSGGNTDGGAGTGTAGAGAAGAAGAGGSGGSVAGTGGESGSSAGGSAGAGAGGEGAAGAAGAAGVAGGAGASGAAGSDAGADAAMDAPAPMPGRALSFDGFDDEASAPDTDAFTAATGFSWELWIFPENVPTTSDVRRAQNLIGAMDGAPCEDIYLGFGSQFSQARELTFVVDGAGGCGARDQAPITYRPTGGFQDDTWYHVVGVVDYAGDRVRLYVDGVEVNDRSHSGDPLGRAVIVRVGIWFDGGTPIAPFQGRIDELRFYDRPLTPTEITAHYASGQGEPGDPMENGLAAGWHLDEGSGTTATDYFSAGTTLTLANGVQWAEGIVPLP